MHSESFTSSLVLLLSFLLHLLHRSLLTWNYRRHRRYENRIKEVLSSLRFSRCSTTAPRQEAIGLTFTFFLFSPKYLFCGPFLGRCLGSLPVLVRECPFSRGSTLMHFFWEKRVPIRACPLATCRGRCPSSVSANFLFGALELFSLVKRLCRIQLKTWNF